MTEQHWSTSGIRMRPLLFVVGVIKEMNLKIAAFRRSPVGVLSSLTVAAIRSHLSLWTEGHS